MNVPREVWAMRFDVFTLFPAFFAGPLDCSILGRAREKGLIEVALHDPRDWTSDRWRTVDDAPFGGGAGMVIKAEPVARALEDVLNFEVGASAPPCPVVYLTPQGRTLNQKIVEELAALPRLALLCGHYEGIDQRAVDAAVTDEISIGDFVLTGGEGAALLLIEALARFVPGVLGNAASAAGDSFATGMLEAPHYTRPALWRDRPVPEVLLSGHHEKVAQWRFWEGLRRTMERRPDLVEGAIAARHFTRRERERLAQLRAEFEALDASGQAPEPGGDIIAPSCAGQNAAAQSIAHDSSRIQGEPSLPDGTQDK